MKYKGYGFWELASISLDELAGLIDGVLGRAASWCWRRRS